ncbi:MAG: GNAT family N-acetyltransferase [Candidatus Pacebacteria bacterium]|nr:GNAT family N-acetyltransferase [Candidatus Paceibacterota bacterium]MBP9818822.1 GNAT family N-acetyltransferase [Candidatus Paceibacterota bacterium]
MKPHISPITPEDLPGVTNILSQSFSDTEDVNYMISLIKDSLSDTPQYPGEFYVVAKDDAGTVLGLLGYRDAITKLKQFSVGNKPIEIYSLFVYTNVRQKGNGRSLVNFLEEYATKNGYDEILVRSADKFKETGWVFYEKMGFTLAGTIEGSTGSISNVYRKSV